MAIMDVFREWLGMRKPMVAPLDKKVRFILKYGDLLVGTLSVEAGVWKFEYSEQYKQSKAFRPLVEFPDVDKIYESKELWQFFASRIPSPEQPEVDEILKREQISEDDSVALLKRFGTRTISNPFQLEAP
ncbi:MAG TPA: HipA N-terminal domain-containing protein [Candidatus Binatia bacterium]|jgi:HipA-like protein|nr:HipA N-terminal domain-containing protein [Candidatus Binatia bacterium]